MSESTALALPAPEALPALFRQPEEIDRLIGRIEAEARAHEADMTTKKGRDAVASLAHKVARSKTALDDAGKRLNEGLRAQINVVDAERRKMRERFDALKAEVRRPLDEWEAAEEARVEAHKTRIATINDLGNCLIGGSEAPAQEALDRLKRGKVDERFEEFEAEAHRAYSAAMEKLEAAVEAERQREAERAELERLRAEQAERERIEQERIAAEQAEAARIAAEKAEAERQARVEREKAEAVEKARREAEERAKADQARIAREASEREAALQRQIEEAKQREERAAQAERDRIAAERKAEEQARAKREADKKHRERIRGDIVNALSAIIASADASDVAAYLMAGKIPHCEVNL